MFRCALQFAPACRNTMAQDTFYGKTWQGVFTACRVSYSVSGPVVADTAANIAGGPTVATAATSVTATNAGSDPLLAAVSPSADQAAPSSAVCTLLSTASHRPVSTATLCYTACAAGGPRPRPRSGSSQQRSVHMSLLTVMLDPDFNSECTAASLAVCLPSAQHLQRHSQVPVDLPSDACPVLLMQAAAALPLLSAAAAATALLLL